jgi:hypothetical protein
MSKEDTNDVVDEKNSKLFKGVVAFVDIKLDDNTNAKESMEKKLSSMGAVIKKTFAASGLTHYIYKSGSKKNHEKANEKKLLIVNPLWVEQSIKSGKRLDEKSDDFKADYEEKVKSIL